MTDLRIGNRTFKLPQSRTLRIVVGVALIIGGILGFLPIVGFWMIPLGLLVLSQEFHLVRRWRRRAIVKWGRHKQRRDRKADLEDEYYD
ncbi:MAG: PGPGW domain-containing protein [Alphaproteobacteria bacterium]|nr:PGPGW domain-containing protein [Alphaproteobacteria bacterium]MDP1671098.1 PGPGW domain-containing protein [Alphaproteobacteria bacterium]